MESIENISQFLCGRETFRWSQIFAKDITITFSTSVLSCLEEFVSLGCDLRNWRGSYQRSSLH